MTDTVTVAVIHFDAGNDAWGFGCLVLAGVVAFLALT